MSPEQRFAIREYWSLGIYRDDKLVDDMAFESHVGALEAASVWLEAIKGAGGGAWAKWRVTIIQVYGKDLPRGAIIDWEPEEVERRIRERAELLLKGSEKRNEG